MTSIRILLPATAWLVLLASTVSAQTIIVNTADDTVDFGGAMQVANLPGPDGKVSLAEAGLASDNTPGVQTIGFNVPQSEWTYQWLYPGRAVLTPFLGFRTFDTAILDATTQTAFTGDTNPNGGEVVIFAQLFMINNVGGAVRGLDYSQIGVSGGSGNVIQGNSNCAIELSDGTVSNLVGGTAPGEGNIGSGYVKLVSASNNVVVGNTVQRVRVVGNGPFQPPTLNYRIGGPTLAERNYITGYGTISSQGFPGGVTVEIFQASGTVIENNWIGTTPDGLSQGHPHATVGIGLDDDNQVTIIRGNRIAGIRALATPHSGPSFYTGTAVSIGGTGSGVTFVGNKVGLNANDQPVLGSIVGITTVNYFLGQVQNVVIGGTAPGEGNEIAGHDHQGILVSNGYSGVRISGNSIHDNGGIGIDLVDSGFLQGVTPNDALDADAGANGLQNFPVLQSATTSGSTVSIDGTLGSAASAGYEIQFFASPQCDSLGYGEGRLFLGSTTVNTSASGTASFSTTLPASVAPGWVVTATATRSTTSSTSEFSACVALAPGSPPTGTAYCFGDGSGSACPCGNTGAPGNGCAHSLNASGANLIGSGIPSLGNDTVLLTGSGMPNSSALYFQGTSQQSGGQGSLFGDGLRCASGAVIRLGTKSNVGGSSQYPGAGDPSVSAKGLVTSAGTRTYQVWYRNAASFCTPSTFNLSNGFLVSWST